MKEFDVWLLAVADRGFLRLVVYPEDDTGFVKKSTASGRRWSVKVSRSKRMLANVLERPRLKGAMSIPIPNDISTTCRTSWCGGVERKAKSRRTAGQFICRGDVTNLQKRAAECSMIV